MKQDTKKRVIKYIKSLHRDTWDWYGIMFRIFIISLMAYIMVFFIQNFGEFIQWKTGYDKPINMNPIAWAISFIYWFLKVMGIVFVKARREI